MSKIDPPAADSDAPVSNTSSTADALSRLDDETFVELVADFWERLGWTVEAIHDPGSWYVDLSLHDGWPIDRRARGRVERPEARKRVSGTDVRHFVRDVQQAEVDAGILVVPTATPRAARNQAAEFNVDVVGVDVLARRLEEWDAGDLLDGRVDAPVAARTRPLIARAPDPVAPLLERLDVGVPTAKLVDRLLPADPTDEDVADLTFSGFRVAFAVAVAVFLSTLAVGSGSLLYWPLMGAFLLVTYAILLPLMAADIYVIRQFEETDWAPTWVSLASFVFVPALFVVGSIYWYRRRRRTPAGRRAAW